MGRPKASEGRDTRQEILDAALELFAENGFFGTGLRDIARAVGIRESAIYHHFPSKEALFEALVGPPEGMLDHVRALAEGPLPDELAPVFEKALSLAVERFATLKERKRFRLIMSDGMRLAVSGKMNLLERVGAPRAAVLRILSRLMEEGRLRKADPEHLALELIAPMMTWRALQALTPDHRFVTDYRSFIRQHVAHFLAAAAPDPPAKPARKK
jgi:AcrR family transcriptional regulator